MSLSRPAIHFVFRLLPLLAALSTAPAWAHEGHSAAGFAAGLAHPFSGLDHLLAMLAVGIWAAQQGKRSAWLLPLVFPLAMAAGAMLGMSGLHAEAVEAGIAASVAVLGLLIAFAARPPAIAGAAMVALFALLHGQAHGVDMPAEVSALAYGAGFIAATALLHLAGAVIGIAGRSLLAARLLRVAGVGMAAVGGIMLTAMA